ncbi:unnamed protein product [Aspergillus oryzae]|nr:unnamed protein product [Aspergillus oryzae]
MTPNDTKVPAGLGLESADTGFQSQTSLEAKADQPFALAQDAFGDESNAEVKYKVLSWCILSGVFVTMISVGITKPGTGAAATTKTDLYHGFSAVSNIVFSYGEYPLQSYFELGTNASISSSRAYRVL